VLLFHFQLAVAEHHLARLPAMEDHFARAALALLQSSPGHLTGRQLQYRLNGCTAGHVN
jgi:hypothetical protein